MKIKCFVLTVLIIFSALAGSSNQNIYDNQNQDCKVNEKSDYKDYDAEYIEYKDDDNSYLYLANIRFIDEFSDKNEGSAMYIPKENIMEVNIIKYTGSITGCVDGPQTRFTVNLNTDKVESKEFKPAPQYKNKERKKYSGEVLNISDERLVEIAKEFKVMIDRGLKGDID